MALPNPVVVMLASAGAPEGADEGLWDMQERLTLLARRTGGFVVDHGGTVSPFRSRVSAVHARWPLRSSRVAIDSRPPAPGIGTTDHGRVTHMRG
jgi:hypothetical protein